MTQASRALSKADSAPGPLARQILWLMALRVVVVTTLLLTAVLIQTITGAFTFELNPIYYLVGLTYLLTLGYSIAHAIGRGRQWFLFVQLVGDLLIITGLIYYSGGLDSAFTFLYILTIITASIMLMRRGGILIACLACVLYGTLVALTYNKVIPPATGFLDPRAENTMSQVYYNLFVRWIGFVAVSLLSSSLAEKLRETGETLERQSADLEQLQIYYEDIINSVNSGLLSTDLEGVVLSLNHAGERILETTFASLRGRRVGEVYGIDAGGAEGLLGLGPEGLRTELRIVTPTGTRRHLGVAVSRLYDRDNLHRGYTFVFQDLSKLKDLERELRLKDRMAAVGQMAAGMAHEIRNPLASMSGSIQMLRADLDLDDEQRTLMEIVLKESTRLNRIIEEFLFYAKPAPPLPQQVDLPALVADVVRIFRNSRELGPDHRIETEFLGEDLTLTADPGQVRQVVWNLMRNAVQAMPEGGRLVVRVGPGDAENVPLFVEDEGPGFDDEESDALWQPFHASSTEGSGLGLAIVYRIVRDHGGRVALTNRPGGGARVSVWLRRAGPVETAAVAEAMGERAVS